METGIHAPRTRHKPKDRSMIEANCEVGQCQVHLLGHASVCHLMSFGASAGICHTQCQERGGHVALDCSVTGAKGLHILTNVTASLLALVTVSAAQLLSGVFLGRMSVFLRSTLDVGEVKRGEGGGQPLSS